MTDLSDDTYFPKKPPVLRSDIRKNQVSGNVNATIRGCRNDEPNLRVSRRTTVKLLENALHVLEVCLDHRRNSSIPEVMFDLSEITDRMPIRFSKIKLRWLVPMHLNMRAKGLKQPPELPGTARPERYAWIPPRPVVRNKSRWSHTPTPPVDRNDVGRPARRANCRPGTTAGPATTTADAAGDARRAAAVGAPTSLLAAHALPNY